MEVKSSWEGRPTNVVVALTVEQVKDVFGKRTKMRELATDATVGTRPISDKTKRSMITSPGLIHFLRKFFLKNLLEFEHPLPHGFL